MAFRLRRAAQGRGGLPRAEQRSYSAQAAVRGQQERPIASGHFENQLPPRLLELLGGIAAAAAALACFVFFGKTGEVEWHKSRARHHEPLASLCKTSAPGPQATRPPTTPKAQPVSILFD